MKLEEECARRHLRPGVAGGDERIRLALHLQPQPDAHGAVRLAADDGRGSVSGLDDIRCIDDLDAIAMAGEL
jgi:hypothetical protein